MSTGPTEVLQTYPAIVDVNSPDFEVILGLRFRALDEPMGITERQPAQAEDFDEKSLQLALVSLRERQIVAACRLRLMHRTAELGRCGVEPELQHRGLGKALLEHAERLAAYRGMDVMKLTARPTAAKFYEKSRYEYTGEDILEHGRVYRGMQKTLFDANAF